MHIIFCFLFTSEIHTFNTNIFLLCYEIIKAQNICKMCASLFYFCINTRIHAEYISASSESRVEGPSFTIIIVLFVIENFWSSKLMYPQTTKHQKK